MAQISPGKLSKSHAGLEGSGKCLSCHDRALGQADKCLGCHTLLRERVAKGQGLHTLPPHKDCKACHVEHQGAEADLVWWGKAGREAFDHQQTGYVLEGRHAGLACEKCHRARLKVSPEVLSGGGASPTRTYLGLGSGCTSCHDDVHRATSFGGRDCRSCHTQSGWKPAPGFDHGKTAFPLLGRHAVVACVRCHPVGKSEEKARKYSAAALRDCATCHADVHQGRLGGDCVACHSPAAWKGSDRAGFDHGKTGYPLEGRHSRVTCPACHTPGRPLRMQHDRCADCHADAHQGQLAVRADRGRCESCHDVAGFTPSHFGIEEHQKTRYPLAGAHLAVACDACHAPKAAKATIAPATRVLQFRLTATRCVDCHRDVHLGELDKYLGAAGCESCHVLTGWKSVSFDHGRTHLPLKGGHAGRACGACHPKVEAGTPRSRVRLAGTPATCGACHKDAHAGQFLRAGAPTPCEACHTTDDVTASRFDHRRDAAFALDGAHARVACAACHKREQRAGREFVRYKPVPSACKDCHRAAKAAS